MSKPTNAAVNKNSALTVKPDAKAKDGKANEEAGQEIIGYCKFEFKNKILFIGQFKIKDGVRYRDGKGKLIHPTSDNTEFGQESYDGDWKMDKMDGYGVYSYANGDRYEGEFKLDLQSGFGKYFFTDGSKYIGEWKDHRMHGTGKYWDNNGVLWGGEFRNGCYLSKEQARLKEDKRTEKKIIKLTEIGLGYIKAWEEAYAKVDKKNAKEILSKFFPNIETAGILYKEPYPKYEERTPDKWNEAIKTLFANNPTVNVINNNGNSKFTDKNSILTAQLTDDFASGQIIEIESFIGERTIQFGIVYNSDVDSWLIIFFNDVTVKAKK